jgi:chromosomal replication initiator protein
MTTERNAPAIWTATLGQLELQVTRANFDTWLRDTVGLRHEDGRFVVGAQNDFAVEWLGTRLRTLISKTLARVLGHAIDVTFEVVRQDEPDLPALLPPADDVDIPEMYRKRRSAPPALNPAMTFDSFVVGEENRLAYEAARRAAAAPRAVNPLVIFGDSGLGKTHLLNAIGHAAFAAGRAVIYAPAERFGNDYVRALSGGLESFRNRYRTCDVLILDDIQFFEGKEKFQEELFHAFNDLHAAGKQIVVSSDRLPAQLSGLMDALRSRLQWGLVADLQKPSYDTRLAILRAKAAQHASKLPESALRQIAERCCPTVRELEGYLNRVLAYAPLIGGDITPDVIEKALSPLTAAQSKKDAAVAPDRIIDAVCRHAGVTVAALAGRSRSRDLTYARHLAMYLLKEDAKKTIAEIGRTFGNRDHSTVIGGIQRITMELATRPETTADLAAVRTLLLTPATADVG